MKIFPQPASDLAYISWDGDEVVSTLIRVYSSMGELMFETHQPADSDFMELNLTDYPTGLYVVELQCGATHLSRKLLIHR